MSKFKLNDRVIWDIGFGYEIGYFRGNDYKNDTTLVLASGKLYGSLQTHNTSEVFPYSLELVERLTKKYKYEKKFSEIF